jgi:hypothetical protein
MPRKRSDGGDEDFQLPEVKKLGGWPTVEETIREHGENQRASPEEMEAFINEIKTRRGDKSPEGGAFPWRILIAMILIIIAVAMLGSLWD